jgi:hypothetical protein
MEIAHSMRKILTALVVALTVMATLSSCLNSSDSDTTVYDDMAITAFTLGTLNRYLHTTSKSGADSVYKTSFTGSTYVMAIDQIGKRIYNQDSLPYGTDLKHVLCTITTRNNGYVFVKSQISDSVRLYSSTDSIDFSVPRELQVYATDGSGHRSYNVTLTARQRANRYGGWAEAPAASFPQRHDSLQYRFTAEGLLQGSEDFGQTWTDEPLGDDASLLPTEGVVFVSWPLSSHSAYSLMVGRCSADSVAMTTWRKVMHSGMTAQWTYMPIAGDNIYYLPLMDHVSLVWYDGRVLAFGSNGTVYQCYDQGISWKPTTVYALPDGVDASAVETVVADDTLWLRDTVSGKTYYWEK